MPETPVVLWPGLDETRREALLSGREFHHLCRVLRLRAGRELELRDGRGLVSRARIARLERQTARLDILACERPAPEPGPRLRLALPLLKGRRLDWALEKGTELGVSAFHLYLSRHNVVRRERAPERYSEIVASAFCQSHRLLLPELDGPAPFAALLERAKGAGWQICWADERLAVVPSSGAIALCEADGQALAWVGPEGGFSAEERSALEGAGALPLSLGPWRLRSETAALALACRFLLPREARSGASR